MSEFNRCAQLYSPESVAAARKVFADSTKPFQGMLNLQNELQLQLQEKLPHNIPPSDIKTKGELIDCLDKNFDAIMDEFRELKTSVGGMSKGEKAASAVWKSWKSDNQKLRGNYLIDMSEEDRLEMKFEMVDIFHFIMNMATAVGLDYEELFVLYLLKNSENANRYKSGY